MSDPATSRPLTADERKPTEINSGDISSGVSQSRSLLRRFFDGMHRWQNLTSAMIALGAAAWAWQFTQKQIDIAQQQLGAAASQAESAQKQLIIASKQAELAQKQFPLFERDQRPILWIESQGAPRFDADNEDKSLKVSWNYGFKNIGKSSALDVRHEAFLKIGSEPFHSGRLLKEKGSLKPVGTDTWPTALSRAGYTRRDFDRAARPPGIQLLIRMYFGDSAGNMYQDARCLNWNSDSQTIGRRHADECEKEIAK